VPHFSGDHFHGFFEEGGIEEQFQALSSAKFLEDVLGPSSDSGIHRKEGPLTLNQSFQVLSDGSEVLFRDGEISQREDDLVPRILVGISVGS